MKGYHSALISICILMSSVSAQVAPEVSLIEIKPRQVEKDFRPQTDVELEMAEQREVVLRRTHAPEMLYVSKQSYNESETIHSHTIAAMVALNKYRKLATIMSFKNYWLEEEPIRIRESSGEIELRLQDEIGEDLLYVAPVLGYSSTVTSPALRLGFLHQSETSYAVELELWTPWDENTIAAREDARVFSIVGDVSRTVDSRHGFSAGFTAADVYLAENSISSERYEGRDLAWRGRYGYDFFQMKDHILATGYLGEFRRALQDDYQSTHLEVFTLLDGSRYKPAYSNSIVPREEHSLKLKIGLEGTYVFSPRLSFNLHSSVGQDSPRDIRWGKLYDLQGKVYFILRADVRLWLGVALESQSSNGVATGETTYTDFGFNIIF